MRHNNMTKACYIGIDTSNYTTSVAVANEQGQIIANLKSPLPVKAGERGLRQSEAVFSHVKNLPSLMDELEEILTEYTPVCVGVSATPRDVEDSYMPCFLSGVSAAHALCAGLHVPLYTFSHQSGHVMAALYSANALSLIGAPFGAFHVSGGTTEMLYVTPRGKDFSPMLVGGTNDLNAGQAIDRIGVAMGLPFPCGVHIEALARENARKLTRPRISVKNGTCNLSGLENMAMQLLKETEDKAFVAAFVLDFIADTLIAMAKDLRARYEGLPLLFAGGVMSNRIIAEKVRKTMGEVYFAEPQFSADNAAGIALLARARVKE